MDVRQKLAAARKMIQDLCSPKYTEGHREWVMRIPAEPDYDPDLVISAPLDALEEEIDRTPDLSGITYFVHKPSGSMEVSTDPCRRDYVSYQDFLYVIQRLK